MERKYGFKFSSAARLRQLNSGGVHLDARSKGCVGHDKFGDGQHDEIFLLVNYKVTILATES